MARHMILALTAAATALLGLNACGGVAGTDEKSLTVLLDAGFAGSWPAGLDPATSPTARANLTMMNAIYGGLFQLTAAEDGANPTIVGVLAKGYEIGDAGTTLSIYLREGVVFSDGTPFDAEAVDFNIERSLQSACTCAPRDWPWAEDRRVTIPSSHTVQLHFSRPFGAAINALPVSNLNWIVSPTALKSMGTDRFRVAPVGAGPFLVVENQLSSRLVLQRNPTYWDPERPYVDRLIFQPIGSEQAAYQALMAGDAHVFEGMTSPTVILLAQANEKLRVTLQPATAPYVVQLNTTIAPFNDKRAREAIYYATNVDAIRKGLFHDWFPATQSFMGPGSLFYEKEIPGYRTHDLERAKAIVRALPGLQVSLGTIRTPVAEQVLTALQTQWREAGIDVRIELYELPALIREFQSREWQAILSTVGSYDPEAGSGVSLRFRSDGIYSGVRDEQLDRLLSEAAGSVDRQRRRELYIAAAQRISDNAYAPFLFAFAPAQVALRQVSGPGLSTKIPPILVSTGVLWHEVALGAE